MRRWLRSSTSTHRPARADCACPCHTILGCHRQAKSASGVFASSQSPPRHTNSVNSGLGIEFASIADKNLRQYPFEAALVAKFDFNSQAGTGRLRLPVPHDLRVPLASEVCQWRPRLFSIAALPFVFCQSRLENRVRINRRQKPSSIPFRCGVGCEVRPQLTGRHGQTRLPVPHDLRVPLASEVCQWRPRLFSTAAPPYAFCQSRLENRVRANRRQKPSSIPFRGGVVCEVRLPLTGRHGQTALARATRPSSIPFRRDVVCEVRPPLTGRHGQTSVA